MIELIYEDRSVGRVAIVIDEKYNTISYYKGAYGGEIRVLKEELLWFVEYLRTKSMLLLPQMVKVIMAYRARWSVVKQELVKL